MVHLIEFLVARGGFYSYYIHQGKKSDKERKIVREKSGFMHTKRFNTFLKRWVHSVWVQSSMGAMYHRVR